MLLFFMVTTVMREVDLKVKITLPEASEVEKLEDKALVDYIYIGPPTIEELGTEPGIQLNDQYAKLEDIQPLDRRQPRAPAGGREAPSPPA